MCIYCTILNELYCSHTSPIKIYISVFRFLSIATITTISLCNGNLGVPCKQNERQALVMLLSWVGEGDCCNWTGVVRDNLTGHVRELHLGNYYLDEYLNYSLYQENSLGGKVNTSLLNLKHLSYLDLSNNDFGGTQIFSFLGSLKIRWNNSASIGKSLESTLSRTPE
ncbi:hypothetical protein ACE6H2_014600 [Prunus campanulata]